MKAMKAKRVAAPAMKAMGMKAMKAKRVAAPAMKAMKAKRVAVSAPAMKAMKAKKVAAAPAMKAMKAKVVGRCASGGCIVHAWQAVSFLVICRRCSLGAAGPDHPSWEGALRRYRLLVSDSAYLLSGNKTDDKGKFVSCVFVRIFYKFDLVNHHRRISHGLLLICEF